MIKGNCRWIVIGAVLAIVLSFPIWAPPLFQVYIDIYTGPTRTSARALVLKKYLELINDCNPRP